MFGVLLAAVVSAGLPFGVVAGEFGEYGSPPRVPAAHPPAATPPFPTPIRHVFIVMLENARRSSVLAEGPFEQYLQGKYASAGDYYAVCHPSAPNYLAITSGKAWQCGSDGYSTHASENIGDLAEKAGESWAGFEESMPTPCNTTDAYPYAVKHNPFVYYPDIVNNRSECRSHDVPFTNWTNDLANGTIPALGLFTPNLTDDGHDTGVAFADHWLKDWLSPLLNDSFFASSVFFVTYDESVNDSSGYNGTAGGKVYFTAVSPFAKPGYNLTRPASHYDLLSTAEWLLGLGNCSHSDGTAAFPPLTALFDFGSNRTETNFTVSGTVTSSRDSSPIDGARVTLTGVSTTTTNRSGEYRLSAPNGSYTMIVAAAGYLPRDRTVVVNGTPVLEDVSLDPQAVNGTFPISGTVTDRATGASLGGAFVGVTGGASTVTNATGSYRLNEPNGSYQLAASLAGYRPAGANATVQGAETFLNFSLARAPPSQFQLLGTVSSESTGAPVVGAIVTLDGGIASRTNGSGEFAFELGNGTHALSVAAVGYAPSNGSVVIAGQSRSVSLWLEPSSGAAPLSILAAVSSGSPTVSEPVSFRVNESGGVPPYTAVWGFGDGGVATGDQATHSYAAAGSYTARVVVNDTTGAVQNQTLAVRVSSSSGGAAATGPSTGSGMPDVAWVVAGGGCLFAAGVGGWWWQRRRSSVYPGRRIRRREGGPALRPGHFLPRSRPEFRVWVAGSPIGGRRYEYTTVQDPSELTSSRFAAYG
jgi:hypothetical protein